MRRSIIKGNCFSIYNSIMFLRISIIRIWIKVDAPLSQMHPSQIPACGITAPGSSAILASTVVALLASQQFLALPKVFYPKDYGSLPRCN